MPNCATTPHAESKDPVRPHAPLRKHDGLPIASSRLAFDAKVGAVDFVPLPLFLAIQPELG